VSATAILSDKERRDWVRLARSEGVGPVTFFGLLARFGSVSEAIAALPDLIAKSGRKGLKLISAGQAEDEIAATRAFGGEMLGACEPAFSKALSAITPPPPIISVHGHIGLLAKPTIGIVGARNASAAGLRLAREFAAGLGQAGFVVASGLARGIDGAAHLASLERGTIAVLAGGIDHIYPPEHEALHGQISARGLIVSESPLHAAVHARDFPRRNRIISGLSLGVVVVEAEARSGSLITARFAGEQGREVLAVPGSPLDPRAAGPNGLIKEGARLVTCVEDIVEALQGSVGLSERETTNFVHQSGPIDLPIDVVAQVYALLSPVAVSLEDLSRDTGLPWRMVAAIVVELELNGKATTQVGGRVSRPV
jgi:DNA processing protein